MSKQSLAILTIALLCWQLTGCAGSVPMEAAPAANTYDCAQSTVRLPDEIAGFKKRQTNAQATGAWGDPTTILTRCGLPVSEPTTKACINVNGIDWIVDESQAPLFRFEAYGREPGFEAFVDSEAISGTDALIELAGAVTQLPQVRSCSNISEQIDSNKLDATDDSVTVTE